MKQIMKTKIMSLLMLAAGCFAWTSCAEDDMEMNKGSEPLKLSASARQLVLDQRLDDKEALQLTWTPGSNEGTGAAISYRFEMDIQGNDFAGGVKKEIGKTDSRVVSYTHKELNDLLLNTWSLPVEEEATFEARVTAVVAAESVPTQVSEIVTFKLTPYKFRILNLWMIGDATPNGWTLERATPMNPVTDVKGGFVWEGLLQKGEFKLLTNLLDWTPAYNRDETQENKLVYRDHYDEDNPDTKFAIEKVGTYRVELSIETLDITIKNLDGEVPYTELWIAGSSAGNTPVAMVQDADDPFSFVYNGKLVPGKFQIVSSATGTDCDVCQPATETESLPASSVIEWVKNGTAATNFWNVTAGNKYTLKLNLRTKRLSVSQYVAYEQVWMMGDVFNDGWNWDVVTAKLEMTQNPDNKNQFIYEGSLSQGEIKFPVEIDRSYGGKFIIAMKPKASISSDTDFQIVAGGDNKWKIEEAGDYKIVVDLYEEKVFFTKK